MQKHFYLVTLGCHQISNLCCWIFPFDFLLMFWHEENSEKAKESKQEKKNQQRRGRQSREDIFQTLICSQNRIVGYILEKKKISGQRKRNTGKGKEAIEKEKTNDTEEKRSNIVLKER